MKVFSYLLTVIFTTLLIACSGGNSNYKAYETPDEIESTQPSVDNKERAGELLYMKYCMACHQTDGSGVPGMYPPLKNSPAVNSGNKEDFIKVLLNGLRGPIEIHGQKYNQQMPSQNFLSDEELAHIINYVSKSFENKGAEVTPNDVKKLRK
jgi:mono/diheme cytochrome c family protein